MHHVTFTKLADKPSNLTSSDPMTGPFYAVYAHGHVPAGWVTKHDGQWVAWNMHGDFWLGYGKHRDSAAVQMLDASWRHFVRNK